MLKNKVGLLKLTLIVQQLPSSVLKHKLFLLFLHKRKLMRTLCKLKLMPIVPRLLQTEQRYSDRELKSRN